MAFICQTCGKEHSGLPLDIGFKRPADYFEVPEHERDTRCELTSDWCIIDGRHYFLRGCLFIPVRDSGDDFVWGMWAEVSQQTFERYRELRDSDGSQEPSHAGTFCGEPRGYAGLDRHPLSVQFGPADKRPRFTLKPSDHLMYNEQQAGITQHRVHEILQMMFPDGY
jgi:hypothetical protein